MEPSPCFDCGAPIHVTALCTACSDARREREGDGWLTNFWKEYALRYPERDMTGRRKTLDRGDVPAKKQPKWGKGSTPWEA